MDPHLVLLFESIPLACLHLVDVLEQVCHSHSRVELPCVVWRTFSPAMPSGRTTQQAAGLVYRAALLI